MHLITFCSSSCSEVDVASLSLPPPPKQSPGPPDWCAIGESVQIRPYNYSGVIAYVGPTDFAQGLWVGVELDVPMGTYFDAQRREKRYKRFWSAQCWFLRPLQARMTAAWTGSATFRAAPSAECSSDPTKWFWTGVGGPCARGRRPKVKGRPGQGQWRGRDRPPTDCRTLARKERPLEVINQ